MIPRGRSLRNFSAALPRDSPSERVAQKASGAHADPGPQTAIRATRSLWLVRNFRLPSLRTAKMAVHFLEKHRQALRPISKWRRTRACFACSANHDPDVPQTQLRSAGRLALAVMLEKTERFFQPRDGRLHVRYTRCGSTVSAGTERFKIIASHPWSWNSLQYKLSPPRQRLSSFVIHHAKLATRL